MRIAYFVHWAEQAQSGVISKIRAQTTYWSENGHEVAIFILAPAANDAALREELYPNTEIYVFPFRSRFHRLFATVSAVLAVINWSPNIAYRRQMLYHPAISYLAARVPMVIEVNTNDVYEFQAGSKIRQWLNLATRQFSYSACVGVIFVTQELSDSSEFEKFDKPKVVVANGIELSKVDPLPPPRNDSPSLVFLGSSGQRWHGVDKIAWLAQQRPDWSFHMVGPSISELGMEPSSNLTMHGYLEHSACRDILARADVAIGTLALHRKGMNEACPLKVREYLAAGLPTIIGYNDTDFPDEVPFILRLPNIEKNIDVSRVEQFVGQWQNKRIDRKDISHLDISAKETSRLQFFRSVIAKR